LSLGGRDGYPRFLPNFQKNDAIMLRPLILVLERAPRQEPGRSAVRLEPIAQN